MKCHQWLLSCASVVAFFATSCSTPLANTGNSASSQKDAISDQVYRSINNYRGTKGKNPLTRHQGLDHLATQHSRFLVANSGSFSLHGKKVSHYGFEGRVLAARRAYSMDTIGENVAAGKVSENQAGNDLLKLWQTSKGHHKQILEDWDYTGIGSSSGADGTVYCTQIFATQNISRRQTRDRFNGG
jgi:uncharacterized protein YkwD